MNGGEKDRIPWHMGEGRGFRLACKERLVHRACE